VLPQKGKRMKINQLLYFSMVCKYHSISAAAEVLNVTQPCISVAIKNLENEIGLHLFNRENNHFVLTKEGEILDVKVRAFLKHYLNTQEIMVELGNPRNHIRLGVTNVISGIILPTLYFYFKKCYPNINVEVQERTTNNIIEKILSDEIDVGIIITGSDFEVRSELEYEIFDYTHIVCCQSKAANTTLNKIKSGDDLGDMPIVCLKSNLISEFVDSLFKKSENPPNILMQTEQIHAVKSIVRTGMACGFLFEKNIQDLDALDYIKIEHSPMLKIGVLYKKEGLSYNDINTFVEFLKKGAFCY
jgi:DNA-binding transcriptional LysR family regulator